MKNWLPHKFEDKKPYLLGRMQVIKTIRQHFDAQDFWEVETPILQTSPVMDTHIHAFDTALKNIDLTHKDTLYLHTSPEFAMKKLMTAGLEKQYQIAHVFRNGEGSPLHSAEFTLLEWYRTHTDYTAMMEDCEALLRAVAIALNTTHYRHKDHACDPFAGWQRLSVREAFLHYADIEIDDCLEDVAEFAKRITEQGIRVAEDDRWDDLFFRVMAEKIEPFLGMDVPCILYDYPASMASLSRRKPADTRYAERFELYVCGIELANAFSELTDPTEQRTRFEEEMDLKDKLYGERYPIDEDFMDALDHGLPESSGIALGVDRLAMLANGAEDISQVLWMPND